MVKKLVQKGKMATRIVALAALMQTGCATVENKEGSSDNRVVAQQTVHHGWQFKNISPSERRELQRFFIQYAQGSPTARNMLHKLADAGTTIEFFDKEKDENNVFAAGLSDESTLSLNRLMMTEGVSFDDTFFHEGEHVLHLSEALRYGINARSFRSLDDVYIYATIMEALAYRKAALCCGEQKYNPDFERAKKEADEVFIDRLSAASKTVEDRQIYERDALIMVNSETNILPNQVYFDTEPNWNQIVSIMSRGEVTSIPVLPKPTLDFLQACVLKELQKNPNAQSLDEFDLSCVLAHQSSLRQDEMAIKKSISDLLCETYDSCCETGSVPDEVLHSFLYLAGWPTKQQMEALNDGTLSLDQAREQNLQGISLPDLFDNAQSLIDSEEVQKYQTFQTQIYGKLLYFEKQILCPYAQQQERQQGRGIVSTTNNNKGHLQ